MFNIYLKELLELTRDKKTLIFTILLPTLVMPILIFGFGAIVTYIDRAADTESLDYYIVGAANYPELTAVIKGGDNLTYKPLDESTDFIKAVNTEQVRFILTIPDDTQIRIQQGLGVNIEVLYNAASSTSVKIIGRLNKLIANLKIAELEDRMKKFNVSSEQRESLISPIKLIKQTTASERESFGEMVGGMLPYILILVGLSGAMYPAIDLGVGEKERGTLETLLLTPVSRFQVVFAKFLVIFTTSLLSILLALLSFALIIMIIAPYTLLALASIDKSNEFMILIGIISSISLIDILLIFLMLVPVAAIFGSVLLSVSIYARTYKEAQSYMQPLMIVSIMPVILSMLPGVKLNWVWASVPLTNVALAIKEIFKGTIDYTMLVAILGSTTIFAGALLYLCNLWFQREQVLFRN